MFSALCCHALTEAFMFRITSPWASNLPWRRESVGIVLLLEIGPSCFYPNFCCNPKVPVILFQCHCFPTTWHNLQLHQLNSYIFFRFSLCFLYCGKSQSFLEVFFLFFVSSVRWTITCGFIDIWISECRNIKIIILLILLFRHFRGEIGMEELKVTKSRNQRTDNMLESVTRMYCTTSTLSYKVFKNFRFDFQQLIQYRCVKSNFGFEN